MERKGARRGKEREKEAKKVGAHSIVCVGVGVCARARAWGEN